MTWLLVTTRPEESTITPEPRERWVCCCGTPNCGPKKRRNNGSSISGLRFSTVLAAETVTTAGTTRLTIGAYDMRSASADGGTTRVCAAAGSTSAARSMAAAAARSRLRRCVMSSGSLVGGPEI
jgi:hypothetical protein